MIPGFDGVVEDVEHCVVLAKEIGTGLFLPPPPTPLPPLSCLFQFTHNGKLYVVAGRVIVCVCVDPIMMLVVAVGVDHGSV